MKLYEINDELDRLAALLMPDEDGVYEQDPQETCTQIMALTGEKKDILEWIAKLYLNNKAEADAIKAEEKRLADRRKKLENKNDWLLELLDRECDGEKMNLGVATVSYRVSEGTVITNEPAAISWLSDNCEDALIYQKPKISLTEVKKLIKGGQKFEWAVIEERRNCSLK